jgi:hypothetical protein
MAPILTHLVVGERIFPQIAAPLPTPEAHGAFLLGCILVDVNSFEPAIARRVTHFIGPKDQVGRRSFTDSSRNFIQQQARLLRRPWQALTAAEQAFVAGYLCHLAADESWKLTSDRWWERLGVDSVKDFPMPPDVFLTAFSVLSGATLVDPDAVAALLAQSTIPDVLTHVTLADFERTWQIVQPYALENTPEAYFELRARQGQSAAEVDRVRQSHARYWELALTLIRDLGGVEPYLQLATEHALQAISRLPWPALP